MNGYKDEAMLVLAIAASLLLIGIGEGVVARGLGRAVAVAFPPPRARGGGGNEGRILRREHERTLARLAEAEAQINRSRELLRENHRLAELLDFCEGGSAALVAARVIAVQGAARSGDLTMIVDKGARAGARVGMAVITPDGLVGRIAIANDFSSAVEPLYSRRLAVSVYDTRTRVVGIARWSDGLGIALGNVPLHCEVAAGDTVLTSGLGGRYPRGVRVGVVDRVEARDYELFRRIDINPAVELRRLDAVLIVLSHRSEIDELIFDETDQTLISGTGR